jgi:uncharacterized protein YqjF (DUF2071 family)
MSRPFLTARWQDLALITYAVPRGLLEQRLPPGLELDERGGQVFVSLVAFDFRDCRVWGVGWPGMVNFPEVNLRYYVREKMGGQRGVVFVREFVPSRVIAGVAKWVYNEPYTAVSMTSHVTRANGRVRLEHTLRMAGRTNRIAVEADEACITPDDSTADHFFKEHSWGYGTRRGRTLAYQVHHPVWQVCRSARVVHLDVDFAAVYGREWGALANATPAHVMLATGSAVEVMPHRVLRPTDAAESPQPCTSESTAESPPAPGPAAATHRAASCTGPGY